MSTPVYKCVQPRAKCNSWPIISYTLVAQHGDRDASGVTLKCYLGPDYASVSLENAQRRYALPHYLANYLQCHSWCQCNHMDGQYRRKVQDLV